MKKNKQKIKKEKERKKTTQQLRYVKNEEFEKGS